jgi:hypothetical protein
LVDILAIAVCAMICAAEMWEEIAEFGHAKESWFRKFLALPNGRFCCENYFVAW